MKKLILGLIMLFALQAYSQSTHNIDFETGGTGADWTWIVDQNGTNPPLEFINNPVSGGINTSLKVAKFTAKQSGMAWALTYTDSDGLFTFDASNAIVKIMVYKPNISNVAMKFEGMSPAVEIQIPNTLVNQWEEMTFDFTPHIGKSYSRIVVIPDFTSRPNDRIIYFDNIQVPDGEVQGPFPEPTTVPPPSPHQDEDVISIYSDDHPNVPNTNYNPNWGQSTIVTVDYVVAGNNTLRYENLNYQGTEYTNQDVSLYEFLHVDFWTPNSTNLSFFLISPGAEIAYELEITQEEWVSVDIPLTAFVPPVNLSNVFQFKVVGNGIVYFDNLYFWKNPTATGQDATLSNLMVDGDTIPGFAPGILTYEYAVPFGSAEVPEVTATPTNQNALVEIFPAASVPGTTEVVVTSADGTNTLTYSVVFTQEPSTAPPLPPQDPEDVFSIYSDAYNNWEGTNFDPFWGQQTIVTLDYMIAGNNTLRYQNLNFQGTELVNFDVSEYDYFHLDFWTSNSTSLMFYLISPGPQEKGFALEITPETWVSVDIPLEYFSPPVNISDIYQFKVEGNGDVWFDNWYFWKEEGSQGTLTFHPGDGATNVPVDIQPTLTFSIPVIMSDGTSITNADIPDFIVFKEDNAGGTPISFTGEINAEKTLITLTPDSDLEYEQAHYVELIDAAIGYQGGNLIPGQSITFTTLAAPKPYLALDVQDNFEDNGWGTITSWEFQDGPDLVDLDITIDPVDPGNHVADYNRSGTFLYTNAQFILDHRMDLTQRNKFELRIYFPSSNDYGDLLTPTAALKLQNSLLGANAYTTQTEVVHTVTDFDEWLTLLFDFGTAADSVNYDQVVVQLGGENHTVPAQFYFDDIRLKSNQTGIDADFGASPRNGYAPLSVQFTDLSSGATPSSWEWDFDNDGTVDSNEQNPLHIYENPGTYSVRFKASNPFFNDEMVKTDLIVVNELFIPGYIYSDFEENVNAEFDGWPVAPEVVPNPDPSGINTSAVVGKFSRPAEAYSNIFTIADSTINFDEDHFFMFSVYAPVTCEVVLKLENSVDPTQFAERTASVNSADKWQSLAFNFSDELSGVYDKIIIFFDFESTTPNVFYFDDVKGPEPNGPSLYKPLLTLDVQDNFEDDGYGTMGEWLFEDPEILPLTIVEDPEDNENHVGEFDRSGNFSFTNARAVLDHRMKLTTRNVFRMLVYFPSSNDYTGSLTPTAAVKLQNSLLGANAWTTQTEIVKTVSQFDQWVTLNFDFSIVSDREDYDQIVVQFGGENHLEAGLFYFDDFKLLAASGITALFEATPVGGFAPLTVQFNDLSTGNPTSWEWDFDNDGTVDSQVKNPSYTYSVPGTYSVKLKALNPFFNDEIVKTDLIVVSGLPLQQTIEIPAGWSGISSYVVPQNAGIEDIFGMYTGNIEIIVGDGGIYFPAQGVNTIGNWDAQSGYLIKMTDNTPVTFAGFDAASKTISVGTGWSVIPVTGNCPANTDTLFDGHPEVIAVKEAAGTGIYWPAKGINTLTNLMPGKAYYILTTQEFTFTYPECSDGYQLIWSDDFN